MGLLQRFRERLALGGVLRHLDGDESLLAWTHARVPGVRAPAVLVITDLRCVVHIASSKVPDRSLSLSQLARFRLDRHDPELVRVHLSGVEELEVEFSLSSRTRSRKVGRVLAALSQHEVAAPESFDPALTSPLPPLQRSARHHARRVWVTVVGALVLLVSVVFASPFVPGPGALTAVAGVAILAREYEWARDLHVWAARQADRFLTWLRSHGRGRRAEEPDPIDAEQSR